MLIFKLIIGEKSGFLGTHFEILVFFWVKFTNVIKIIIIIIFLFFFCGEFYKLFNANALKLGVCFKLVIGGTSGFSSSDCRQSLQWKHCPWNPPFPQVSTKPRPLWGGTQGFLLENAHFFSLKRLHAWRPTVPATVSAPPLSPLLGCSVRTWEGERQAAVANKWTHNYVSAEKKWGSQKIIYIEAESRIHALYRSRHIWN